VLADGSVETVIAGHTHLPVFFNSANTPQRADPDAAQGPDPHISRALRDAHEAWAQADAERLAHEKPFDLTTPCYFNAGCCSFGDGDITGIELQDGEIRLVRWPCDADTAPQPLAQMALAGVFTATGAAIPT